jgi:beta-phosphoglucomutase-like phosphatase (HAD superfamily)
MSIEALIFDVDGTLADTEEAHRSAFNAAFERLQLGWSWSRSEYRDLLRTTGGKERITSYIHSLPLSETQRRALIERVPAIHAEKTKHYSFVVRGGGVPLRIGVARLLMEAFDAGCRLGIATTTTAENVDALLTSTLGERGLDMFSVIACGDQVREKKPAPDIYRLALNTLGVQAENAVAFEDSVNGLKSAVAAGLWTVITPTFWTADDNFSGAGIKLPHFGDADHPLPEAASQAWAGLPWLTLSTLQTLSQQPRDAHPLSSDRRPLDPSEPRRADPS